MELYDKTTSCFDPVTDRQLLFIAESERAIDDEASGIKNGTPRLAHHHAIFLDETSIRMIRNVVFDVGNVMVRWSPAEIVHRCFDLAPDTDAKADRRRRPKSAARSPATSRKIDELSGWTKNQNILAK